MNASEPRVRERTRLLNLYLVLAIFDIAVGIANVFVAAYTDYGATYGAETRAFKTTFLNVEVMVSVLLAASLLSAALGLLLEWSFAWWQLFISQCIVAFLVMFTYASLAFVLINTWGYKDRMWAGGDTNSLAIVTFIFIMVETLTAITLLTLIGNRPDRHIVDANHSHEV